MSDNDLFRFLVDAILKNVPLPTPSIVFLSNFGHLAVSSIPSLLLSLLGFLASLFLIKNK